MIDSEKNIILWDSNRPADKEKSVWLMQGYDETINHRSILKYSNASSTAGCGELHQPQYQSK